MDWGLRRRLTDAARKRVITHPMEPFALLGLLDQAMRTWDGDVECAAEQVVLVEKLRGVLSLRLSRCMKRDHEEK